MTDLVLYHAPQSRSVRVLWQLEEMGLPYELKSFTYDPEYFASEEFRRINPIGQIPALYDGDEMIIESTAIMEYLLSRHGPSLLGVEAEDVEYACFIRWLHMSEAGMAHYLTVLLGHRIVEGTQYNVSIEFDAYCEKKVKDYTEAIADQLQGRDYLLQRGFSAADISLGYSLYLTKTILGITLPESVDKYFTRLQERPAWQKAITT